MKELINRGRLKQRTIFIGLLLLLIFSFIQEQVKANVVGVYRSTPTIVIYDETNWTLVSTATLSMAGYTVTGGGSVTQHPGTGEYYVIVLTNEITAVGRKSHLAKVDPVTGICLWIGVLGEDYYSIAFNTGTGALYAMQGDENALPAERNRLSRVNPATASTTYLVQLGIGVGEHTIAFNSDDNKIYLWTGDANISANWLQKIDPVTLNVTFVSQSGFQMRFVRGAVYKGGGVFVASGFSSSPPGSGVTTTSAGVVTFVATAPALGGLAFIAPLPPVSSAIPFYGSTPGEGNGAYTTGIGDFNGDGFDDFLITTVNGGGSDIGTAEIYFGKSPYPSTPPNPDITITGLVTEGFGNAAAGDFDLNHDGFKDIIIGASKYNNFTGKVYIFYGRCDFPQNLSCTAADMIIPGNAMGDRFGFCVSKAGDLNGDCHDDIIFSAPWENNEQGIVYILYGDRDFPRPGSSELPTLQRKDNNSRGSAPGTTPGGLFGYSMSYLGDMNNDNIGDVIVSEPVLFEPGGSAYIFYGDCNSIYNYDAIIGEPFANDFGTSVAGLGDINGNGCRDFAIGDWRYPDLAYGKVYVYDGCQLPTGPLYTSPDIYEITGDISSNADGRFSNSLAGVGDYTGDGFDDFIIGARAYSDGSVSLSANGREYRFPGGPVAPPKIINTSALMAPFILMSGITNSAQIGYSSSWAGDINGDGRNDELWSGTGVQNGSSVAVGAVYLDLSNLSFAYTKINLKAFIAGRYLGGNSQIPTKVKVSIYNQTGGFVDEKNVTLNQNGDALDADGTLGIKFNDFQPNAGPQYYYIVIESMCNGVVKTWSKVPMLMQRGGTYQYDFTTAANMAYGDNQIQVDNSPVRFALYNGAVAEDYCVDLKDMLIVFNDASQFASGDCCLRSDINGDGLVDLTDLIYVFSNQFVCSVEPFDCPCN